MHAIAPTLSAGLFRLALVASLGALASCGTQINTLRDAARSVTGATGVPPALSSLTVDETSPTRRAPLALQWGVPVGQHSHYCLLENSQDPAACVWRTGALPATYADTATDGPLVLTAYLKNAYGVSDPIDSNAVVIDRTAPNLASAAVTNADPTGNPSLGLNYGLITNGTYDEYCINVNNTAVSGCSWTSGSVPASFTIPAIDGSKTLTIFLRDAAGNVSNPVYAGPVTFDGTAPTVGISSPAAGTYVNAANVAAFAVSGTCSEDGRNVVVSGAASATATCASGAWSANLDFSGAAAGAATISVNHSDAAGNAAVQASRGFTKDAVVPTVAIASPAAGAYVNAANVAAFPVTGTCSEDGRNVVVSGAASATAVCTAGAWSANLDFTAAAAGAVSITVNHSDAAGNAAVQASRGFTKDAVVPAVAIASPAAGSYVNAANVAAFAVSGTCSENGRSVVVSGDASATVVCTGGAWSANLDFSAAAAGAVSIDVNHADAAGNPAAQASRGFTKDAVVPAVAVTSPAAGSVVNNANLAAFAVSGTCSENGRDVVISGDAAATVACAAGAWSANLDFTAASDGPIAIAVDHADAAGNPATTATLALTKTTGIPSLTIASPAAGAYVNAANVAAFAVSGTCSESGEDVVITGTVSQTVGCLAGGWTASLDFSAAAAGAVSITANHADSGGNPANAQTRSFTKDVTAATVAITAPAAGAYVNAADVAAFAVSGTCSENGRAVSITGSATGTATCAAGAWTANLDFTAAAAGALTVNVSHADAATNPAATDSRNFTKDVAAPTLAISTPAAGAYVNAANVAAFAVTGTCSENGRDVVISGDASATVACAAGAWSANLDFSAAGAGAVSISVDHADAAGNPATTAARSFTKDVTLPTVAVSAPAAGAYVNAANVAAFAVSGACSEDGRDVAISGDASATVTCASGAWSANLDFSAAAAGAVSISVNHSDAAGNAATTATRSFTKDVSAPTLAITSPAAGSYVNASNVAGYAVSGTCSENGRDVVVSGDAAATVACTAGAWSASLNFSSAAAGAVAITVDHADAAGNAATTATRSFTKDVVAPVVALTSPNGGESWAANVPKNVTWTATDTGGTGVAASIKIEISTNGGTSWANVVTGEANDGLYAWSVPASISTTVRLRVTATDLAGNSTTDASNANFTILNDLALTPATFSPTLTNNVARLFTERMGHEAQLGDDGKVYVFGGASGSFSNFYSMTNASVYDPATELWTALPPMNVARVNTTSVKLSDGRFFVAGGLDFVANSSTAIDAAAIFDPVAGKWSHRKPVPITIYRNTMTRITGPDGKDRVLLIGGKKDGATYLSSVYVYDPATDSWTTGTSGGTARADHSATLMPDGRIFVAGGNNSGGSVLTAQIYDPVANSWSSAGTMANQHANVAAHYLTAAETGLAYDVIVVIGAGGGGGSTYTKKVDQYRVDTGVWSTLADSATNRGWKCIVKVGGKLLAVGGIVGNSSTNSASVEELDVAANTWTAKASMPSARGFHSVTLLPSGKILVAGGTNYGSTTYQGRNYLYDTAANTWAETGSFMMQAGNSATVKLADGKVLRCGGYSTDYSVMLKECYVFDPSTSGWSNVGSMNVARQNFTLTLLPDGKVLAAGGRTNNAAAVTNTAELYDPATKAWTNTGSFTGARRYHAAVLLQDGATVLLFGGDQGASGGAYQKGAQRYSIAGGTWSAAGTMAENHGSFAYALLADGRVFANGGFNGSVATATTELYDPATNAWSAGASSASAHGTPAVSYYRNGADERVYLLSGWTGNGGVTLAASEYYVPATDTWTSRASIAAGQERYTRAVATTSDGYVYLFGGTKGSVGGGSPTSTIYRYGIAGNAWSAVTPSLNEAVNNTAVYSTAELLDDGRILVNGHDGTALSHTELYSFTTTQVFVPSGGDLDHTLSLFSGLGTFFTNSGLYVPGYWNFSARGGPGGTARLQVDDGSGNSDQSDVTIP